MRGSGSWKGHWGQHLLHVVDDVFLMRSTATSFVLVGF